MVTKKEAIVCLLTKHFCENLFGMRKSFIQKEKSINGRCTNFDIFIISITCILCAYRFDYSNECKNSLTRNYFYGAVIKKFKINLKFNLVYVPLRSNL